MENAVTHDMGQAHDPTQCHCVRCRPLERPCGCQHCELHMTEAKARHFKTAIFTDAAHALEPNLPMGPVRVKFMSVEFNAFFNVDEPVFCAYRTMDDESFIGTYFARALKDYVL